ncbi:uncharacterized protein LOC135338655 [Halichondria panicea]|uniref:uncharacterized protein LOC135338655 n=1 Tax=Halichondria panicea TaxID=6063 RepID=UPI00312B9DE0
MAVFHLVMSVVLLCFTVGQSGAISVSLTVEGGASLIGEHCPGTVRLFCEGVDLTSLRWSYNVTKEEIHSFYPDSMISTQTVSNPAFISVELSSVLQSDQRNFGNFSSTLTLNISELEEQHINEIRCGDPVTHQTITIDVQVRQQALSEDPQQINIVKSFKSSASVMLTVSWEPPVVACPASRQQIRYEATLTGNDYHHISTTNSGTCTMVCSVTFTVPLSRDGNYVLELQAINNVGRSDPVLHNIFIVTGSSSNGVSVGVTVATTVGVFIFSLVLGFVTGVSTYYIVLKKLKLKRETETRVQPRENAPEIRIQESREIDREVVYSNPETAQQNEGLTHSYCEADDPIIGSSVYTKSSVSSIPNESYGKPKKERSRPDEEMRLKANLSYDKVGILKRSGARRGKMNMEANQSYGLARVSTDPEDKVEYDYVDNELLQSCK